MTTLRFSAVDSGPARNSAYYKYKYLENGVLASLFVSLEKLIHFILRQIADSEGRRTRVLTRRVNLNLCYSACEDILYDNPIVDSPYFCETCIKNSQPLVPPQCTCSGSACRPELPLPAIRRTTQTLPSIPMAFRLTEEMIEVGTIQLQQFRHQLWDKLHDEVNFLSPLAFLPDAHIKNILDNFAHIKLPADLSPYVNDLHLLSIHEACLFLVITELQHTFSSMRAPPGRKEKAPPASEHDLFPLPNIAPISAPPTSLPLFLPATSTNLNTPSRRQTYDNFWTNFGRPATTIPSNAPPRRNKKAPPASEHDPFPLPNIAPISAPPTPLPLILPATSTNLNTPSRRQTYDSFWTSFGRPATVTPPATTIPSNSSSSDIPLAILASRPSPSQNLVVHTKLDGRANLKRAYVEDTPSEVPLSPRKKRGEVSGSRLLLYYLTH